MAFLIVPAGLLSFIPAGRRFVLLFEAGRGLALLGQSRGIGTFLGAEGRQPAQNPQYEQPYSESCFHGFGPPFRAVYSFTLLDANGTRRFNELTVYKLFKIK